MTNCKRFKLLFSLPLSTFFFILPQFILIINDFNNILAARSITDIKFFLTHTKRHPLILGTIYVRPQPLLRATAHFLTATATPYLDARA